MSQWLSWQSCCSRPDKRCLEGNKSFSMSGRWNEEQFCEMAGNEREVGIWEPLWGQQCHPIIQLQVSPMPGFVEWPHYKVLYWLKPLHSCILWIPKNIYCIFSELIKSLFHISLYVWQTSMSIKTLQKKKKHYAVEQNWINFMSCIAVINILWNSSFVGKILKNSGLLQRFIQNTISGISYKFAFIQY